MIYLTKRLPELNQSRFYALHIQLDLFDEACVVAEWGRIGSPGTVRSAACGSEGVARASLSERVGAKVRRGYNSTAA